MIVIAESGSTKTDWRMINAVGEVSQAKSLGINPNYVKKEDIEIIIKTGLNDYLATDVTQVFFYGSGCGADENKAVISDIFKEIFPNALTEVNHDVLAAARALCGHDKGIACILGTGSNSCLYDGTQIIDNVKSLGYILADEGSGNWLGKKLLMSYFRNTMPKHIKSNFRKRFEMTDDDLIRNLYTSESPVKYLANFSKFIFQNIQDPFLYRLVYDSFDEFVEVNVKQYADHHHLPVHFTGSVAFYFSNILRRIGNDKGLTIRHVVEGPIAGLTLYHQKLK